jgi:hypothetical protein
MSNTVSGDKLYFLQMRTQAIFDLVEKYTRQAANAFGSFFPVSSPQEVEERIPVFFEYKNSRFDAQFLCSSQQIEFRGDLMAPTPATYAAVREAGGTARAGSSRSLWKFLDKDGQEQTIETLRQD